MDTEAFAWQNCLIFRHALYSGADPGFFLGGGALLRNDVTDGEVKKIYKGIRIYEKESFVLGRGRGGAYPLHLPPRSAPDINIEETDRIWNEFLPASQLWYTFFYNTFYHVLHFMLLWAKKKEKSNSLIGFSWRTTLGSSSKDIFERQLWTEAEIFILYLVSWTSR